MKSTKYPIIYTLFLSGLLFLGACHDRLEEPAENRSFTEETDYSKSENMIMPLKGAYAAFQSLGWESPPLISVRGDDVNHGGEGDQQDFAETDYYNYNQGFWMYNTLFQQMYSDIFTMNSTMEEVERYVEEGASADRGDQYIAEAKVMRGWMLLQLTRVWGDVFIPETPDPSELYQLDLVDKNEVLQHISDQMDEAIQDLPDMHPNERSEIPGGVTRYTAQAIKAQANLELEDYQAVADATADIISSGEFRLMDDFYNLFKIPGKLSDENILELQYSDFGEGSGDNISHLFAFYAPQNWTPKVEGAGSGWGFYEPSLKWIKFMLDRGERTRLETSVLFTNEGIEEIQEDPDYSDLPEWISNETPSGDVINDFPRANFSSGKHYLPSDQLTPGRTDYGMNKNYPIIRYAEVLLMYAEALTNGASGSDMTADEAVNEVRERAGLSPISDVTTEDVLDEKFAELGMEWGIRYYDMVRYEKYDELSYEGREFSEDKIYLPYPQTQVDLLPVLGEETE
ncbi:MAG: RagB/SusD family nutrient uptake outer membrane protein [Marinilabiliaceae bacterium]